MDFHSSNSFNFSFQFVIPHLPSPTLLLCTFPNNMLRLVFRDSFFFYFYFFFLLFFESYHMLLLLLTPPIYSKYMDFQPYLLQLGNCLSAHYFSSSLMCVLTCFILDTWLHVACYSGFQISFVLLFSDLFIVIILSFIFTVAM